MVSQLIVVLLCVDIAFGGLLSFKVASRAEECFFDDVNEAKNTIDLEYEVIEGGDLDIGISITSDTNQKIMHKLSNFDERRGGQQEAEKVQLLNLQHGTYKICFNNIMASKDYKVIVIQTPDKEVPTIQVEDDELAEKSETENLKSLALDLEAELEKLEQLQRYTQRRLHRHLWTQESTASRSSWMTIFQMIVVVFVVIVQTVYIKTWFRSKQRAFRV